MRESVKNRVLRAREKNNDAAARASKLRSTPQRKISPYEIAFYAVAGLLFVMAGAMPSAALFTLVFILPMLYVMYRRFGIYLPASMIVFYGVFSLTLNYDILTVVYLCALAVAFFGLVLSCQFSPYLLCATIAAVAGVVGMLGGVGVARLAEGRPVAEIAGQYVLDERDDPFIKFLSERAYTSADIPEDIGKLSPDDPDYDITVAVYYAKEIYDELKDYAWYYCIHIGAVLAAVAYFAAVTINRRSSSAYDAGSTNDRLNASVRSLGGCLVEVKPVSEMSVPRAFLWTCLLPAAVAGIALELVGGYDALSATIMHAFVTLPSAFCFFTLLCYFASLFRGKARPFAYVVLFLIGAAMVIFPFALFVGSLIGVCDVILNLRFWTEFLMSD